VRRIWAHWGVELDGRGPGRGHERRLARRGPSHLDPEYGEDVARTRKRALRFATPSPDVALLEDRLASTCAATSAMAPRGRRRARVHVPAHETEADGGLRPSGP